MCYNREEVLSTSVGGWAQICSIASTAFAGSGGVQEPGRSLRPPEGPWRGSSAWPKKTCSAMAVAPFTTWASGEKVKI